MQLYSSSPALQSAISSHIFDACTHAPSNKQVSCPGGQAPDKIQNTTPHMFLFINGRILFYIYILPTINKYNDRIS